VYHLCFHSEDIASRTLVLLLAFDFATSNVQPLPSRQERHPVVWKILKFEKTSGKGSRYSIAHTVTFSNRLAFTKAERLTTNDNEERWVLSPNPKLVQEVNAKQETMLVQDPNDPKVYSFAEPNDLHYNLSLAMNGVADDPKTHTSQVDIAFGFFETTNPQPESKPAQILCFHDIPQYTPVSLEFVPFLQAYFVPEDYYREGEVLTMPIPSPLALQVDISSLSKGQTNYSVSVDGNNRAIIKPAKA
jgi:hypothetical protein